MPLYVCTANRMSTLVPRIMYYRVGNFQVYICKFWEMSPEFNFRHFVVLIIYINESVFAYVCACMRVCVWVGVCVGVGVCVCGCVCVLGLL